MKMKKKNLGYVGFTRTQIVRVPDQQGKSIEEEIRLATASKAPIESVVPEIYTPLNEGVMPQYDIRADRQEIALDATDKFAKSDILHSDEKPVEETQEVKQEVEQPKNE